MYRCVKKIRYLLSGLIRVYQKTLSPDHSFWAKHFFPVGYCKYTPSCSEYSRRIIQKSGVVCGSLLSFWRIIRCNPWSKGGIDDPE